MDTVCAGCKFGKAHQLPLKKFKHSDKKVFRVGAL